MEVNMFRAEKVTLKRTEILLSALKINPTLTGQYGAPGNLAPVVPLNHLREDGLPVIKLKQGA